MAKRSRPDIRRRVVTDAELAAYLGKSVSWLAEHRLKLEQQGFPKRLAVIGGNDLAKVDEWVDQLHTMNGNGASSIEVDELWKRATGQCLKTNRVTS
jgi:hypothetical protein